MAESIGINPNLARKVDYCAPILCWTVIVIGSAAMAGWVFQNDFLKSIFPGSLSMRPNIALGLIICGCILLMIRSMRSSLYSLALAAILLIIGLASFWEYSSNFEAGFTSLGFETPTTTLGKATPQRLDLISSLLLSLSGFAFLLRGKKPVITYSLFSIIISVSLISLVGHLYGIKDLQGIRAYTEMGVHTSVGFMLVSLGIFATDYKRIRFVSIFLSQGPGGFVARRLIFAVIFLPVLLGALKLYGQSVELFSTRFGTALLVSSNILAFISVVFWISSLLEKMEKNRIKTTEDRNRLQEQSKLRDRFISTLSHDLRNPLSLIRMNAEMILESANDQQEVKTLAKSAVDASDRIDYMIEGLLDAGKIESGQPFLLKISHCDLKRMIEEAVIELERTYARKFILKAPKALKGSYDCSAIRRAFENLISNAIKYGSPDPPITVSLEEEKDRTRLSVHNFGGYIPPQQIERLFSSYHRLDSAINSENQGWGLGLTLVKGVAQAHGGKVEVQSSPDSGTTFSILVKSQPKK